MDAADPTPNPTPKKKWMQRFINSLAAKGNVTKAARAAKISRDTAYEYRESDPMFARAWKEALEIATELMEAEARRRAVEGVLRPVFQGKKLVGKVRDYSDTLLIFLLKAHKPEMYRDSPRVTVVGDPSSPVKHDHTHTGELGITVTAADVAAARAILELGTATGDVHRHG